jgi:lysophospholipase L1-like esterase
MTTPRIKAVTLLAVGTALYWSLYVLSGAWLWLSATLAAVCFIGGAWLLLCNLIPSTCRWRNAAINTLVAIAATGLVFTTLELLMPLLELISRHRDIEASNTSSPPAPDVPQPSHAWVEPHIDPEALKTIAARGKPLTMPPEWKKRRVDIPGAKKAYYWQGALQVYDENEFRRTTPFPLKRPGTFRILVVGDSLTYGFGIDEYWTYPAVLERKLRDEFNVEMLDLGVGGYQSADIRGIVESRVPKLKPDLVIYGVCLNDFLPSDTNQDVFDTAYALPLPRKLSARLTEKTRLGAYLSDHYDALLRNLDLRQDFFDGILAHIDTYRTRIAKDVAAMNAVVESQGLPPMIGMVLDQYPRYQGRGYRLARVVEESMRHAGFRVVATDDYYRRYNERNLRVSPWEGHPDEEAHQIFAAMLYSQVRNLPELAPYRRTTRKSGPALRSGSTNAGK